MIMYHATYGPRLDSILRLGLIPRYYDNFGMDSEYGVYLCSDPYVAESFMECADEVDDDLLDDIIILQVDCNGLTLECDPHVNWDENPDEITCKIFRNIISPERILIFNKTTHN